VRGRDLDVHDDRALPHARGVVPRVVPPTAHLTLLVERGRKVARVHDIEEHCRAQATRERKREVPHGRERLLARAVGYGVDRRLESTPELEGREREETFSMSSLVPRSHRMGSAYLQ
jgi:hypothetical protein